VLFLVDDMGGLYISAASYGASDSPTWRTWLLEAGQPPNAPVAALRGYPEPDQYTLFWVGADGSVRMAVLYNNETQPRSAVTVSTISGSIASPGAAIAALQRTPWVQEVFVVGAGTLWQLTGMGGPWTGSPWNVAPVGPSSGQVVANGPVSAVATDATSVDLFYINRSRTVQHLSRVDPDSSWNFDPNLRPVMAAAGTRQLSAV
jgi:hypothetical protein